MTSQERGKIGRLRIADEFVEDSRLFGMTFRILGFAYPSLPTSLIHRLPLELVEGGGGE